MSAKRTRHTATRADVFMYIVRVFLLRVAKSFALGKNTYEQHLDSALEAFAEHGIAPIHLARVSNALVYLLNVINAEYDDIDNKSKPVN